MKAGAEKPNWVRIPAPAGMNEAWRGFCRPGTILMDYTSVAVQV